MAKLIINMKTIVPDKISRIDENYTLEHKKLVEEANRNIEEGRIKERNAWINAKSYYCCSNLEHSNNDVKEEQGPVLSKKPIK